MQQLPQPRWRWWTALGSLGLLAAGVLWAIGFLPPTNANGLQTPGYTPPKYTPPSADRLKRLEAEMTSVNTIRVGLSDNSMQQQEYPSARIGATGGFRLIDQSTGQAILQGTAQTPVGIRVDARGFIVDSVASPGTSTATRWAGPLRFEPEAGSLLKLLSVTRKGQVPTYRGFLEVTRGYSSPTKLSVVNVLDMQDYLRAVVPNELPMRFGFEAVKAQAVAARNYAIRPREKPWPQFDICDSQYCQAYYGQQTESDGTDKALAETEGLVALYQGEPILALYSSSHGGHSEDYANAFSDPKTNRFPATPLPYLVGQPDTPEVTSRYGNLREESAARTFWSEASAPSFDVKSSYYRWERHWPRPALEARLNQALATLCKDGVTRPFIQPTFQPGQSIGTLKRLQVLQRGVSGKVMTLAVEATNGTWQVQKEFVIRKLLGEANRMLPSANVVFSHLTSGETLAAIRAQGGGFGHGVGMSQYGASWMSGQGSRFPEILQHYYRGVAIGSIPLTLNGPGQQLGQQLGQQQSAKVSRPATAQNNEAAVQSTFYVRDPQWATLRLKQPAADSLQPVYVKVNDTLVSLNPDAQRGAIQSFPVQSLLKPGVQNRLILYPDDASSGQQRHISVWVELFPAQSASASRTAPFRRASLPSQATQP
ncbi:MAG: SpoIID/LytB domain-containing protein [Candidatus Melainabacteria bacterium]|nr:SpoIID/LytB domain-containing protein [Candidatus Melainabacteria bacterium]